MATQKQSLTHPTARQLAAFALGKVTAEGRGRMQQHLDGCPECSTFLSKTPRDTLVDLLRKPVTNVPASEQSTPGVRDSSTVMPPPDGAPAAASPAPRQPAQEKRAGPPAAPPRPAAAKPSAVDEFVAALGEQTKYRVVRLLGHGGMGRVYEAFHERMGRRVALKVIDSPLLKHPDALRRFDQEVKAAANLDHPNLARAYDADEFGSTHVLVMEFIAGESLDKVLAHEGPMSVARACDCIRQAAAGLAHAHQQGMVHRDLKPQNLMLTPEGRVKILDFGLAKVTKQSPSRAGLTRENSLMGTPHYLAPEQALDAASADIRADIYSLGCTLYCLLAGSPPFEGDTEMKVLLAHQQQVARPLCEVRPDVPRELSDLVARMLAKNPAERPQSPGEVGQALLPFITAARPPAVASPPVPPVATPAVASPAMVEIPFADEPRGIKGLRPRAAPPVARQRRSLAQSWQNLPPRVRWPVTLALGLAGFFFAVWGISVLVRTPRGTILIENVPEGAQVFVDGEEISVKGDHDLVTIQAVTKGDHTLKITRDGKSFWSKEVTIDFGGDQVTATYSPFEATQTDAGEVNREAVVLKGLWSVNGDELIKPTESPLSYVLFGPELPSSYNYTFKAKAVLGKNGFIAVTNSVHNAQSCRLFELGGFDNKYHIRVSTANGEWKDHDYERKPGWVGRDLWYQVRVEVRGPRCKCFLDGLPVYDYSDGKLIGGRVGVAAADTVAHFKDFLVTDENGKVIWQGLPVLPARGTADVKPAELPSAKPYVPPAGVKPIDLLALVDLKTDAIGIWSRDGGAIRSGDDLNMRVQLPRVPPEEYDLRVEFTPFGPTRREVGVICCGGGGQQFAALAGAYGNTFCGFELYQNRLCNVNSTGTRRPGGWLTTGLHHELVVQVRSLSAALLLDGVKVAKADAPWSRFSLDASHKLKSRVILGLVSSSSVRFDKVELYEINSSGKSASAAAGSAPATDTTPLQIAKATAELPQAMRDFPNGQVINGDWYIEKRATGDELAQNATNTWPILVFGNPSWSNYDLELQGKVTAGDNGLIICFHLSEDRNNCCCLELGGAGNHVHQFLPVVDGKRLEGRGQSGSLTKDVWHDVKIEVRGKTCAFKVDGVALFGKETARRANGRIELGTAEGTLARFRNIKITAPDGKVLWSGLPNVGEANSSTAGAEANVAGRSESSTVSTDGFAQLFNGKDLTGWNVYPAGTDGWTVNNGVLVGERARSMYLYTDRDDYTDVHVRAEVRINSTGNSGICVRGPFDEGERAAIAGYPTGYEAQICAVGQTDTTGAIFYGRNAYVGRDRQAAPVDEWFTLEMIAVGNEISTRVNGAQTARFVDPKNRFTKGHVALEMYGRPTKVEFRKVELREITAKGKDATAATAPKSDVAQAMRDFPACELLNGDWRIEGDELLQTSTDRLGTGIAFGDPNWNAYNVTCRIKADNGVDGVTVAWHASGNHETLRCRLLRLGVMRNSRHDTVAMIDGAPLENEAQIRPGTLDPGRWHDIRLEVRGLHCTCYYDREKLFEVDDPRFTSGRFGFGSFATAFRFKDVEITSADGKTVLWRGLPRLPGTSQASGTTSSVKPPDDAKRHGNSHYKVYPEWMTWQQARERCVTLGGHLAVVHDRATNDFLTELVRAANKEDAWLGATDEVKEGQWLWVDGSTMDYTNWDVAVQQPNNKGSEEHYLLIRAGVFGKWSDQPKISTQFTPAFICQWD